MPPRPPRIRIPGVVSRGIRELLHYLWEEYGRSAPKSRSLTKFNEQVKEGEKLAVDAYKRFRGIEESPTFNLERDAPWYDTREAQKLFETHKRGSQFADLARTIGSTSNMAPVRPNMGKAVLFYPLIRAAIDGDPEARKIIGQLAGVAYKRGTGLNAHLPEGFGGTAHHLDAHLLRQLVTGEGLSDPARQQKVMTYALNLMGNLDPATMDSWMVRIATGIDNAKALPPDSWRYAALEAGVRFRAMELGIKPGEYQPPVWYEGMRQINARRRKPSIQSRPEDTPGNLLPVMMGEMQRASGQEPETFTANWLAGDPSLWPGTRAFTQFRKPGPLADPTQGSLFSSLGR